MSTPPTYTHFEFPGDFRVAVNSNKKMKTVMILASFVGNLDDTVTAKALLPLLLHRGSKSYPSMLAINRYLEGLYGAGLVSSVSKTGEWHSVRFRLEVVNERFLPGEKAVLRQALEFLREFLWEPLRVKGGFHPEFLEQEKINLKLSIEGLLDNKDAYASHRLCEEMCRDEPFRIYEQGRVEDIPGMNPESLLQLHHDWVRKLPLHLYLAGDVDVTEVRDLVASVFSQEAAPREGGYPLNGVPPAVEAGEVREVKESMDINQARLFLGFRHGITYADPEYEALLLANGVLGSSGCTCSKLFQNVREKANLAYSVHSSLERSKGLLFIAGGIAPEKHQQALDIILDQVKAVQDGDIQEEEIEATRAVMMNGNQMLEDNLRALADVDLTWRLHGRPFDFQDFRKRLAQVTRDDIVGAAQRLRHDTSYLLTKHE